MARNTDYINTEIEINMGELETHNYEKLSRRTETESPYSQRITTSLDDANVYTEISATDVCLQVADIASPETSSLQPLVPANCTFNRKRIGLIVIISLFSCVIISLSVTVAFLALGRAHNDGNKMKDDHVVTETSVVESTSSSTSLSTPPDNKDSTVQIFTTISPAHVYWQPWGLWTACSATCGTGVQARYRRCNEEVGCHGNYKDIKECVQKICPSYGSWTSWSSWGNCDVTCGEGRQERTRTCMKLNASDVECIGKELNQQVCMGGTCPDCSAICEAGILNPTCNMCICKQVINGRVVSSNQAPMQNVALYSNSAADNLLATTNNFGEFNLTNVCVNSTVVLIKEGFAKVSTKINSTTIFIVLKTRESPYITVHPQAKSRLIGENVTLCCSAQATPGIVYYEWFKDTNILDDKLYPNGTILHLTSLNVSDTGQYSCRASNGYGSIESSVVDLAVKGLPDEYCFDAYEQKRTPLPYDCVQPDTNTSSIEVGDCKPKLCRHSNQNETNTCRDGRQNCCAIFDFDILTVQCIDYQLSVLKVISCGCGLCRLKSVKIVGTVLMYRSGKFARFSKVYLNGNFKTYTNSKGSFKVHVDQNYASAVLTIVSDRSDVATKVIDVSDETTGTIYTTIYIVEAIVSKQFDPSKENIIHIGQDLYDQANAVAELHVPANAFVDVLFELHTASVTLYVTYLDPTNITDMDVMPGLMSRVDEYGVTDYIETFGSFFVKVLDTRTGEKLALIKDINVAIGTSLRDYENTAALYKLNTDSGVWDIMKSNGRFWGLIDSTDVASWLTIGRSEIPGKICYFNVRMFEDSTITTEIPVSRYQFFMQAVHIANRSSYETYGYTFAPSSNCFRTICNGGSGYIKIWISNVEKASDEYLFPVNPKVHDEIGLSADKQNSVQYSASAGDPHLGILYINSIDGPFFNSEASCLAKSYNGNHLKFYFNDYIENVYTQTLFFDIVSENAEKVKLLSQRVWYQQRAEGYRLCFVKAKFKMQTEKHIKAQAVSYGGTNANITNEILGIREVNIFMTSAVCLEYKCSGTIDEQFSSGVYDFTRVRVSTDKSCSVETFSQFLVEKFSDMNPKNDNASSFTFYAPTVYSPSLGIYSASTSSGDIESARTIAKGECRSGKSMDYSSDNPDIGVAVHFVCP